MFGRYLPSAIVLMRIMTGDAISDKKLDAVIVIIISNELPPHDAHRHHQHHQSESRYDEAHGCPALALCMVCPYAAADLHALRAQPGSLPPFVLTACTRRPRRTRAPHRSRGGRWRYSAAATVRRQPRVRRETLRALRARLAPEEADRAAQPSSSFGLLASDSGRIRVQNALAARSRPTRNEDRE